METNTSDTISGRRLTFIQLIKEYHIEIPIIQRDYAQGRPSAYELRISFIDALFDYLEENNKNRDLDFIYGNQLNGMVDDVPKFIPLDGQQRLTTLFLLHWYLANSDDSLEELKKHLVYNNDSVNPKSKFSYETRTSSKEFCNAILINEIDFNNLLAEDQDRNNSLSKTIKDSSWYFLSWETDPTIQSMLVMLDAIHKKFKGKYGYFERLISRKNPVITFQFLDLKEFNLTDDLYIKMNARGIPLTPFENFKAKFEQHLTKLTFNKEYNYSLKFNGTTTGVDVKTYFSHKIDTDWANLFWNHTLDDKKKFDKLIMNFIRAIVVNHHAGAITIEFLKFLIDKKNENISFLQYIKFNCFDRKFVTDLISILDLIKNGNSKVKEYLKSFYYYNEAEIFETVINNSFVQAGYVERIKFYAYCFYLIKWKTNTGFNDIEGLENWMRFIYNLTENTAPYNNEKEFINSVNAIAQLIPNSNNILNHISSLQKLNGFDEIQFKEEKIKAHLILKNNEWKKLIYPIEQHNYFKGQTGFILFLSGIYNYFDNNSNCLWPAQEELLFQKEFKKYSEKALAIFNPKGLKEFPDFIFERALLAKGDYLITEGSNQSFLINFDRDISWKRLLKRDKNPDNHGEIIKEMFGAIAVNNTTKSLNTIMESYQEDDWRGKFIKTPQLFEYLGPKRYVRKDSYHGFVLFSGERMSGAHAELFSYSFFLNHIKAKSFLPFISTGDYYFATGDDCIDIPCVIIENCCIKKINYMLKVYYHEVSKDFPKPYQIRFEKSKGEKGLAKYPDDIKDILKKCNFKWYDEDEDWTGFWITKDSETDSIKAIKKLCRLLNEIQ